jgi:leucyl-tRNA synthetase
MENLEMHSAVRNAMRLFDRIRDFEKRVRERQPELSAANAEALLGALGVLAQVLAPLAPHLGEQLWLDLGHEPGVAQTPWPVVSLRVPA